MATETPITTVSVTADASAQSVDSTKPDVALDINVPTLEVKVEPTPEVEASLDVKRSNVVKQYIALRMAGNVDEILKLFSSDFVMVDSDSNKTQYTGEEALRAFFAARPPPMVTPFISDPVTNADATITLTLSVVVKKLFVTFSFPTDSVEINKIVLTESSVLSGWF